MNLVSLAILSLVCFSIHAQQKYLVHVDYVKPSMYDTYIETAKAFHDACNEHQPEVSWITVATSDYRMMYVSPMENFAELDKNAFAGMAEKMGDKFGKLFSKFDECYDRHSGYVIVLDEELSYMPDGVSPVVEGENYRKFYMMYHTPSNHGKVKEAIKGVKKMFSDKGSKVYYRVYHSDFGAGEDYYMVAVSYVDPVDAANRGKANNELLGEDAKAVFGKLMNSTERFEEFTGWMKPDLYYSPKK